MSAHTQGPWFVAPIDYRDDEKRIQIVPPGDESELAIGEVYCWKRDDDSVAEANANLIAAAPDILEALKGALVDELLPYHSPEWIAAARTAIDKAEGRS